jgi:hypothetical protein
MSPRGEIHVPSKGNSTSPLEQHKYNNINIREETSPFPLLSFGEYQILKLKEKDYLTFCEKYGKNLFDEELITADNWLEANGATRENYRAFMQNWMNRRKDGSPTDKKEDLIEKNKAYAQEVIKTIKGRMNPKEVIIHSNSSYVELGAPNHPHTTVLKFSEHGFKDQLDGELRKRGLADIIKEKQLT